MNPSRTLDRRTFVVDLGRGSLALAVLGVAGLCARPRPAARCRRRSHRDERRRLAGRRHRAPAPRRRSIAAARERECEAGAPAWTRVNLGFVSAYILVRGGEAAIVDTGVAGSARAIEAALGAVGLDWAARRAPDPDPSPRRPCRQRGRCPGPRPRGDRLRRRRGCPAITVPRPLSLSPMATRCSVSRSSRRRATRPAVSRSSTRSAGSSSPATRSAPSAATDPAGRRSSPPTWTGATVDREARRADVRDAPRRATAIRSRRARRRRSRQLGAERAARRPRRGRVSGPGGRHDVPVVVRTSGYPGSDQASAWFEGQ